MVKWISRRFTRCTMLGRRQHSSTHTGIDSRGAPKEARDSELWARQPVRGEQRKVFDEYSDSPDFTYLGCSDVQDSREFLTISQAS